MTFLSTYYSSPSPSASRFSCTTHAIPAPSTLTANWNYAIATNTCRPTACTEHSTPAPSPSTANSKLLTPNWIYTFSAKERYDTESAKSDWFHITLVFHTHGSGTCEGGVSWNQMPSEDDFSVSQYWRVKTGGSAKSAVFGMKDRTIYFYNEFKNISGAMPFDVFISIPDNW